MKIEESSSHSDLQLKQPEEKFAGFGFTELDIHKIRDLDLETYARTKPAIIGLHNEFVSSSRLENLAS